MGQLCDAGCVVTFDAMSVTVTLHNKVILNGIRTPATGLWHLSMVQPSLPPALPSPPTVAPTISPPLLHQSYAAMHSATPSELVAFAHATLFSPALSTLKQALDRGYLPNFVGLTAKALTKHPPHSVAMIKGHLDQARKNQRSTKQTKPKSLVPPPPDLVLPTLDDIFPASDPDNARTHTCYAAVVDPSEVSGQIHSDQTGKFVVASSSGNNYVLVVYDYDSNAILVEPMRSRTGPCILAAFKVIHARLVAAGLRPQFQRLDNECSAPLKAFMKDETIDFQLAPPRIHRRNAAERAIRTFKNHFIAGLCSVDKNFPLHLWDKLLPQAEITLNLLRGSRLNPKLLSHAQMHGHFDFNRTPLAPPGIRVLVHIKPSERTTWSPHGADGWYTGPALESYRCYTVWLWDTRSTRICDTLQWFPTKTPMPLASSTDLILAGIQDIVHALNNPSPGSPLAPLTDSHHDALVQLTTVLTSVARPPTTTSDVPLPDSPLRVAPLPDSLLRVASLHDPPLRVVHKPVPPPAPAIPIDEPPPQSASTNPQSRPICTVADSNRHHVRQQHWCAGQTTPTSTTSKPKVITNSTRQDNASQ